MTFTLLEERAIPEIASSARMYRHDKTGARLLSVINGDENKSFGITFRTPPATSNGVAHIMEHSVLCGSRKYRVKEPFIELAKSSLNTFLNAMTYPDKTCYPVASTNLKDFYNLIDVYLDAVLYPLITPETLQQEGWHYEIESPEAPLTFKGVVFNEMKGALSSPDDLLGELSQQSLYPDTPYGLNSGGDPAVIPALTYADFKAFHETYYHPSNAYIYFYGDDPEAERLRLLDEWLNAFERKDVQSALPLQPQWNAPRQVTHAYDSGDTPDAKAYFNLNWLMPAVGDPLTSLSLSLLAHILLGTSASPLRKALMDSGLGEDVTGGYQDGLLQGYFSAGMKGVENGNLEKVEQLIHTTLKDLAEKGIDPETIAASLNTIEFHLREQNTGRFPRGLALMLGALDVWLYDGDPFNGLAFEATLQKVKTAARAPHYFENLIRRHFIENPHRTSLRLLPDAAEGQRKADAEAARLEKVKAGLSRHQIDALIANVAALKKRQETPDSPEALATIPALTLQDIDPKIKTIPCAIETSRGTHIFSHDLPTNGILYLDLGFDLHPVPAELLPFLGFFGRVLLQMGTQSQDYVSLIQRIGKNTGGIRSAALISTIRESSDSALYFFLRGKATLDKAGELLAILQDVLLTANLDNRERLRQIVMEEKAEAEAGLIPGGHGVVSGRLAARFSEAGWVGEQIGGLENLFFLRRLADDIEKDWDAVLAKLETLRRLVINRAGMVVNLTLDEASRQKVSPALEALLASLPASAGSTGSPFPWKTRPQNNEGLTIPAQVNYVGKGANLYALGYEPHGSIHVIRNYLGTTWLWEKVRVQGGAYGGFSTFDTNSGAFAYLSYRDPNILPTLANYDATPGFLRALDLNESELTKSILGTIGEIDAYQLPDAKGWTSMAHHLTGYTDEMRQQTRAEVLATSVKDFQRFAETLEQVAAHGEVVVLGSAEAVEKANQEKQGFLKVKKVL
ncbi:MAG: peptidase M16 [Anaerolineae bacterium CG_4_9_14_3_um_filter_57_17]|nr:peptidase M16 [bacterium]NCT20239.1 peptidase M16 [bacterium]OIO84724.1 MAG: peptidase M16 [Anaerolineae bacterium CG2_30_57_67]PJB67541.1 MAG: peptidase M16 [Anaerolineae bacterium CG_4_9_14_3_um_filter_57_17]